MTRLWAALVAALVLSVVVDLFIDATIPGLFAVFGLGGCIAIIVVSKRLGQALLQRREDFYERGQP